jgi:RNA polymerase sigma factor (sigma-70 family)
MSSKQTSDGLAHLFEECRASHNNSRQFAKLADVFLPKINKMASKYPSYWTEDFIQEGRLGLLKAVNSFPASECSDRFQKYATSVISHKMVDFYRLAIGKTMREKTIVDVEGYVYNWKEPLFIDLSTHSRNPDLDEVDFDFPASIDYTTSIACKIDIKYCLKNVSMKNNFTDKEIKAFDLHFNKEYSVSEVAKKINVSISQASKIIARTKTKAQQLLAHTANINLN